jgi:hypothetical protein
LNSNTIRSKPSCAPTRTLVRFVKTPSSPPTAAGQCLGGEGGGSCFVVVVGAGFVVVVGTGFVVVAAAVLVAPAKGRGPAYFAALPQAAASRARRTSELRKASDLVMRGFWPCEVTRPARVGNGFETSAGGRT